MKTNSNHIQQGDVLLRIVDKLPDGCKLRPRKDGKVVLAEGEHTGHWHGTDQCGLEILDAPDGGIFVQNTGTTNVSIVHAEHKPVVIEPGKAARLNIVREKDWFTDMTRNVQD